MSSTIGRKNSNAVGRPFAFLALVAFIPVLLAYGQSVAQPRAATAKKHRRTSSTEMKLQRSTVANLRVNSGSQPADCWVAVPDPVSITEAEEAIRSALEGLDFGIDDPEYKTTLDPISAKRSSNEEGEHWTDVVELDDNVLKQSGTSLGELGLSGKDRIYGYQVALRWIAEVGQKKQPLVNVCDRSRFGAPVRLTRVPLTRTIKSPKTVVRLKISIVIYERGIASDWVERSSSYEPKPLRKLVEKKISDALNRLI